MLIEESLPDIDGVRFTPPAGSRTGVLVLAGSSGRIDRERARVLAERGAITESVRWFGGPGQQPGPWEVPLELFLDRLAGLADIADRVVVVGTSFGAEAALLTGSLSPHVDAVVAFAPSDVVWAGVRDDERLTSHWTLNGKPVPFVPFLDDWEPTDEPPAFRPLYEASRERFATDVQRARIPVEGIKQLVLVAGGDDRVWPSVEQAEAIASTRTAHDLPTTLIGDAEAGHRTVLPGEPVVEGGMHMARGGNSVADTRLGLAAWDAICALL